MKVRKKRLLFLSFSILILVGLCIGVFADADPNMFGYYTYSQPYNVGELYFAVSDTEQVLNTGEYYFHFHVNELPSSNITLLNNYSNGIVWYYDDDTIRLYLDNFDGITNVYSFPLDGNDDLYIYVHQHQTSSGIKYSSANSDGYYISSELYSVSEFSTVDVYNNSQDVWVNIASTISEGTNTILDNDILLLFAAALPIISVGVGFLIRLLHKS